MEKEASTTIKTIFEPINERLKGPFTGAFLISWVIINWKILLVIATFDYNKDINVLFENIELKYSSYLKLFVYPLLSALLYIVIAPFSAAIAAVIKELFIKNIKERFIYKIKNSEPIDYEKYKIAIDEISVLKNNNAKSEQEKTRFLHESMTLETMKISLETENMILKKSNVEGMLNTFYNFFEGTWELTWNNNDIDGKGDKELARFNREEQIYYYSAINKLDFEPIFYIKGAFIDTDQEKVFFAKIDISKRKEFDNVIRVLFNDLTIESSGKIAHGVQNGGATSVTYRRISIP